MSVQAGSELNLNQPRRFGFINSQFLMLFSANLLSNLAFSSYILLEQWYVVHTLSSASLLGIVMACTALPRLLFMLLGGVLTDRYRAVPVTVFSLSVRVVMMLGMLLVYSSDLLGFVPLLVFSIAFGLLDAFFWPANGSLLPKTVDRADITRANSMLRMGNQLSMICGPMVASWLLMSTSFTSLFIEIMVLLVLAALFSSLIRDKQPPAGAGAVKKSFVEQFREGASYVRGQSVLMLFVMVFFVSNIFFVAPVAISTPLVAETVLHGDVKTLSYLNSSWAVGLFIGSLAVGFLNLRKKRGLLTIGLLFLQGCLIVTYSQSTLVLISCSIVALMGFFTSMINIPVFSSVQESTEPQMMGRVMSLFTAAANGILPLAFVMISALLTLNISAGALLWFCGIALSVFSLGMFLFSKTMRKAN